MHKIFYINIFFIFINVIPVAKKESIFETDIISMFFSLGKNEKENDTCELDAEKKKDFENIFYKLTEKKTTPLKSHKVPHHKQKHKPWTVLLYIAGANDLYKFAIRNLFQMMEIGSSDSVNFIVHFDFHIKGQKKETKRFFVEKGILLEIGEIEGCDSGDPKNLISSAKWAFECYPSEHFCLILWNHGTGVFDPVFSGKITNPSDFFYYDARNNKISLKRDKAFLDIIINNQYIENNSSIDNISNIEFQKQQETKLEMSNNEINNKNNNKGICYDYTTKNFLDNTKLKKAFEKIIEMRGGKIDIILMDACLMQGVEIADLCAPYAKFLVASQEVVLGPGYNYATTFKSLIKEKVTPYELALAVVKIYGRTYAPISNDFTQSALNLSVIKELNTEFEAFISKILSFKNTEEYEQIKKIFNIASSKEFVTHFSEPSYIDYIHFLENVIKLISQNIKRLSSLKKSTQNLKEVKLFIIKKLIPLIKKMIIANVAGDNLPRANGLYIYYPKNKIDKSYKNNEFALKTKWILLLNELLS